MATSFYSYLTHSLSQFRGLLLRYHRFGLLLKRAARPRRVSTLRGDAQIGIQWKLETPRVTIFEKLPLRRKRPTGYWPMATTLPCVMPALLSGAMTRFVSYLWRSLKSTSAGRGDATARALRDLLPAPAHGPQAHLADILRFPTLRRNPALVSISKRPASLAFEGRLRRARRETSDDLASCWKGARAGTAELKATFDGARKNKHELTVSASVQRDSIWNSVEF